ncbi:hypothetical protein GIB67_023198 [Kingdonia uniflora]|uniref:Uncharacterized protein n=1 Tax=Kingdonia uniflora TaxID=39325 RepID=A0A7J7MCK6_9MAGN|nr:hypothetical protein GIB67_023198 [Kingdonia uniflora]
MLWLSTTKDIGLGKDLSTTKVGGPLRHNSFPYPKPEYRGYPKTNGRGLEPRRFGPFVDDENDSFETIRTDVPPSNEPSIPQSNVHISNKLVLTNVPQSNEPSIPQSSIHLSNEPVLTNILPSNKPMLTNVPLSIKPEPIIGQTKTSDVRQLSARISTTYELLCESKIRSRLHKLCQEWNNVILKVRDLPIHMFIEKLHRICSEMSYTYREEAEKNQARITTWATDHLRALGLANVDSTTLVFEYYINNTYKAVYEPIWIPIRGIEQWKILKTDPRVRVPIPTVRAGRPRTQRKRREKMPGLVTKLRFCSRCRKNVHNRHSCKLLPIPSDSNTRLTMALSFTMSTEPHVIPDEDVAISLH